MKKYKPVILVFLLLQVFTIIGCKNQNEKKKGASDQPSMKSESIINPLQNISIHEAALKGESAEVMGILAKGVNVDTTDQDGRTALMYASYNGYADIMEKLIRKGAAVNLCDSFGRTALMFASSGPYPEAVRLLLKNQADPNIADKDEHYTALMYAASEGQIEVARILLSFNADPGLKDIDGDNALTFAQKNGHKDIVELLKPFLK
jgi:ankyrin repeat protein